MISANFKVELLQSTFLKWPCDSYQNLDILKKWIHDFCPISISTIETSQQTFVFMKTSLKTNFVFVFRTRLQDVFTKTNILALLIPLQKTSWSRPIYSSWSYVFKTSCKNVFKTSSKHLQDVLQKRLQDVLQRCLQYLFKTYHRVKLLWLIRFQDVFETFPIYRRICLGCTSEKFMISVQNLLEWQKFLKY